MRARLALAVSGQSCELREVVLRHKPQALLDASPKATVPVLVTREGQVIAQSLDIMRWALAQNDPGQWLAPETGSLQAMQALIAQCDGDFKRHLDRYKYPGRYSDEFAASEGASGDFSDHHRAQGARFLAQLNTQLGIASHLFGQRAAWADMAIAPFVRQFAETDRVWFDQQPWPGL
ncbi:MAG: glutathione S-transferase, partial [Polaromonas sp.]